MLMANYVGAVVLALRCPADFNLPIMLGGHLIAAALLGAAALRLAAAGYTRPAVEAFYRWVWNLFYAEYAMLPFI